MDKKSLLKYIYITAIVAGASLGLMVLFYTLVPSQTPFMIFMIFCVYLLPMWFYGLATGVDKFSPQTDARTQVLTTALINLFVMIFQPAVWMGLYGSIIDSTTKLILIGFPMLAYAILATISYVIYFRKKLKFLLTLKNIVMLVYVGYLIILTLSMWYL